MNKIQKLNFAQIKLVILGKSSYALNCLKHIIKTFPQVRIWNLYLDNRFINGFDDQKYSNINEVQEICQLLRFQNKFINVIYLN